MLVGHLSTPQPTLQSEGLGVLSPGRAASATPWDNVEPAGSPKDCDGFRTDGRFVPALRAGRFISGTTRGVVSEPPWAEDSQAFGLKTFERSQCLNNFRDAHPNKKPGLDFEPRFAS